MAKFQKFLCCILISFVCKADGDSNFAGSAMTSDSSGTRSVLVTGRNGAAGAVIRPRIGGGGASAAVGGGSSGTYVGGGSSGTYAGGGSGGTFASAGAGGASAYAGPGGAFASPWGFPYWNGGGAYAGSYPPGGYYPSSYPYDPYQGNYPSGNEYGVYSGSDSNGIQTRFANVAPGGQATIVEQNGDEEPKVYTYRGSSSPSKQVEDLDDN